MGNPASYRMTTVSPLQLLGPLNDAERKYAPSKIFTAGPMEMPLPKPRAAIIGSRNASERGLATTARIAKTLTDHGVVIVSGLAEGIDTMAHETAISEGGRTIAVLGTPLNRTYPQKNLQFQNEIMKNHLAISQFPIGHPIQRKDFVIRNRTMALISNASIIVEAGEDSGSLHQGWEALRLGRPLFISKVIVNDSSLSWTKKMIRYGATVLNDTKQVLQALPSSKGLSEIALQVPKRARNAS
jgi:DNA processing protein